MILNICYNDSCLDFVESVCEFCKDEYPDIEVKYFNESHFQEKKKAYRIKGGYSARMSPFMLLTSKDNEYLKAFYSEADECTLDSLVNFLSNHHDSKSN